MKRWGWLFIFYVIYDSGTWKVADDKFSNSVGIFCYLQDPCEDIAHAFNDAHEWRMQKFELEDSTPPPTREQPKIKGGY